MQRIMQTIIISAYILVKVLLKYLYKVTNANSMFLMVKMTIELEHQTPFFSKLLVKNEQF